ncbi:MAG: tetratricopeptide repeat protein [Bdellovibrionales bacterium]|nr:tetratricopeptide repeat protein [Bdellovibrionales bacterium]
MTSLTKATFLCLLGIAAGLSGCTADNAKSRYLLAEKLYADGKYLAAISEFEKVVTKDSRGKLGQQALFRAATTQALYLNQYAEAVRKFRQFAEMSSETEAVWEANRQIGELLFLKLEQYEPAISHYRAMLRARPKAKEAPELLFRIAKSYFYLWHFDEAVEVYRDIRKRFPKSTWAEHAAYQLGVTYFTRAGHSRGRTSDENVNPNEAFEEAIDAFQNFLKKYPKSTLATEALFGIATCLEEMDQLDAAYAQFASIRNIYPSPQVIDIKLGRIKERKEQRSR